MPRFYFHVFNDETTIDDEGADLADLEAARQNAIKAARGLVCESVNHGHLNLDHRIEITNEQNARVLTLTYREAFTIEG